MPSLGARLRARWRALVNAARIHPRPDGDSADAGASQQTDTTALDLRPRVRIPHPDAGSEGPPAEWLDYVMAQDPVWVQGGLGLPGRHVDAPIDDITEPGDDVSTLTSSPGIRSDGAAPAEERRRDVPRPARQRARFVRPAPNDDDATPSDSAPFRIAGVDPATRLEATQHRPPGRLMRPHEPTGADPATTTATPSSLVPTGRTDRAADDRAAEDRPAGVRSVARGDDPPRWPAAARPAPSAPAPTAPAPTAALHPAPAQHRPSPTPSRPATAPSPPTGVVRAALTTPSARTVAFAPSTAPAHTRARSNAAAPEARERPVDPWASTSAPAPIVELRRELDDRPAVVDPPVAVRWRAIDIDRLGIEQRAL